MKAPILILFPVLVLFSCHNDYTKSDLDNQQYIDQLSLDQNFKILCNLNAEFKLSKLDYISSKEENLNLDFFVKNYLGFNDWSEYTEYRKQVSLMTIDLIFKTNQFLSRLTKEEFSYIWVNAIKKTSEDIISGRASCLDIWHECWNDAMDQYDDHHAECVFNFNQNGDVHAYGQCSLEGTNNLAFETEICDDNYSLCEN